MNSETERLVCAGSAIVLATATIREGRSHWTARLQCTDEAGTVAVATAFAKVHRAARGIGMLDVMNGGLLGAARTRMRDPARCWFAVSGEKILLLAEARDEPFWCQIDFFQEIDLRSDARKRREERRQP